MPGVCCCIFVEICGSVGIAEGELFACNAPGLFERPGCKDPGKGLLECGPCWGVAC